MLRKVKRGQDPPLTQQLIEQEVVQPIWHVAVSCVSKPHG